MTEQKKRGRPAKHPGSIKTEDEAKVDVAAAPAPDAPAPVGAYTYSKPLQVWVVKLGGNVVFAHESLDRCEEYVAIATRK